MAMLPLGLAAYSMAMLPVGLAAYTVWPCYLLASRRIQYARFVAAMRRFGSCRALACNRLGSYRHSVHTFVKHPSRGFGL
eukprot:366436-Chlamydomonas_euryale.AAC.24